MRRLSLLAVLVTGFLLGPIASASAQPRPDMTDPDLDGIAGLAPAPETPFPTVPSSLISTANLLIDRSHGNVFNVSGFMNYLASQGWVIAEHSLGPITASVLSGFDLLLIPTTDSPIPIAAFSPPEVEAIQSFLAEGGGLWVLNDSVDPAGVNTLSAAFGVTFRHDFLQDPSNNEGRLYWPTIYILTAHPVVSGVESFGYYAGDCVAVSEPSAVIARGDDDCYSLYCPAGSYPPTLAAWERAGRAVFCGDITPLHPNYYPSRLREEEQVLLQNIMNWLLGSPPTETSHMSWGGLKATYGPR